MYRKVLQANLPLLLPLLFLLPWLGGAPLFDVDEGAFSEATREMLVKGDYLSTWLNGSPRFDKPILIYWLQAISVSLLGVNEWGFRLPSALAAVGWCLVISRFAKRQLGAEAGQFAGLVALTCLGVQLIGRAATADALFNLLLTLMLVDLWKHIEGNEPKAHRLALWVGLGFLTKGPIALLLPGAALLLWSAFSQRSDRLLALLRSPVNWLILLGTALPWYLTAYAIHGDAFIQGFFMRHNVQRFSTPLEGHHGSLFYYIALIPLLVLPWLPWLANALRHSGRAWNDPFQRYLWLWFGFVILFFSLSGTKLPHYALYGCSPLFILIAARHADKPGRGSVLAPLALLALFAALPFLATQIEIKDAFYQAQLSRLPERIPDSYLPAAIIFLVLALLLGCTSRYRTWQRVGGIALLCNLFLSAWLAPLLGDVLQGPIRDAALQAKAYGQPIIQWKTHWPSFSVYLNAETAIRAPRSGEIAVMRLDRIPDQAAYELLFSEGGVVLLRFLADPDTRPFAAQ